MNLIPLQAVPAQNVLTTLDNGQAVELRLYTRRYGNAIYPGVYGPTLYMDIYINNVLEIGAVICQNLNRIIRSTYLNEAVGFAGDFIFNDTQGTNDPAYQGLGTRYQLLYFTEADLTSLGY
jgi:hypothetical protein